VPRGTVDVSGLMIGGIVEQGRQLEWFGPGTVGPTTMVGALLAVLGALLAATLAWRRPQDDAAFYTVVTVALLDVVLLVLAT